MNLFLQNWARHFVILIMCASAGCRSHGYTAGVQELRLQVLSTETRTPMSGVTITHEFGTRIEAENADMLADRTLQFLEYEAQRHLSEGVTDQTGTATITIDIAGPQSFFGMGGPGPDQVTGSVSVFRVNRGSDREYLVDRGVSVGNENVGSLFVLRILSVGEPKRPATPK